MTTPMDLPLFNEDTIAFGSTPLARVLRSFLSNQQITLRQFQEAFAKTVDRTKTIAPERTDAATYAMLRIRNNKDITEEVVRSTVESFGFAIHKLESSETSAVLYIVHPDNLVPLRFEFTQA